MATVYGSYLSSIDRDLAVMNLEAAASWKRIEAMEYILEASKSAAYMETEAAILMENGSVEDLYDSYYMIEAANGEKGEGVLAKIASWISEQLEKFAAFITRTFGGKGGPAVKQIPDDAEVSIGKEEGRLITAITNGWNSAKRLITKVIDILLAGTSLKNTEGLMDELKKAPLMTSVAKLLQLYGQGKESNRDPVTNEYNGSIAKNWISALQIMASDIEGFMKKCRSLYQSHLSSATNKEQNTPQKTDDQQKQLSGSDQKKLEDKGSTQPKVPNTQPAGSGPEKEEVVTSSAEDDFGAFSFDDIFLEKGKTSQNKKNQKRNAAKTREYNREVSRKLNGSTDADGNNTTADTSGDVNQQTTKPRGATSGQQTQAIEDKKSTKTPAVQNNQATAPTTQSSGNTQNQQGRDLQVAANDNGANQQNNDADISSKAKALFMTLKDIVNAIMHMIGDIINSIPALKEILDRIKGMKVDDKENSDAGTSVATQGSGDVVTSSADYSDEYLNDDDVVNEAFGFHKKRSADIGTSMTTVSDITTDIDNSLKTPTEGNKATAAEISAIKSYRDRVKKAQGKYMAIKWTAPKNGDSAVDIRNRFDKLDAITLEYNRIYNDIKDDRRLTSASENAKKIIVAAIRRDLSAISKNMVTDKRFAMDAQSKSNTIGGKIKAKYNENLNNVVSKKAEKSSATSDAAQDDVVVDSHVVEDESPKAKKKSSSRHGMAVKNESTSIFGDLFGVDDDTVEMMESYESDLDAISALFDAI